MSVMTDSFIDSVDSGCAFCSQVEIMKRIFLLLFLGCSLLAVSQEKPTPEPMYPSYKGLVMAGYQGWFRAEGDGPLAQLLDLVLLADAVAEALAKGHED